MKKIISMLLAFSMSLSVMCSSFTVAAVDGNDTAAQTDTSPVEFSSLFSDELNEKAAALSDDYGITSVEVNVSDGTAAVSYHAVSDCAVIVGIYEDDETNTGTHMLTFGTAALSAENTVGTVAINESLPEYFYVKAYIVEQGTFKPLAKEYTTPNYTKAAQDFLDLTVSDFIEDGYDEDHILNLDGSESNNFMVFDKRAKILNFDTQISVDDLTLTSSVLTVKQNADAEPNIANLKKGDPFLFFTTKGVLAGIASSVSYDGSSAVINYTDAATADVFDHIKIDTSDITPRQSVAAYSARSNDRTFDIFPIDATFSWTEEIETSDDAIAGASGSIIFSGTFKGDLTISYISGYKELVADLSITPEFTIEFTGEGHIGKEISVVETSVPIVGTGVINLLSLKFGIDIEPIAQLSATAKATVSTTMNAKADTNKPFADMLSFEVTNNSPQLEVGGEVDIECEISFSVGLAVLEINLGNESEALFNLDLVASATPGVNAGSSEVFGDSMKHLCKPMTCFDGEMSVNLAVALVAKSFVIEELTKKGSLSMETPLGTLECEDDEISLTMLERDIWPEEMQKFNIKLDPSFKFSWGECDNYAYRTYFDVEDELTGDKLEDIFVYTKDVTNSIKYSEDTTNRGGRAVLYLKPNESFKIVFRDNKYICDGTETNVAVTEPDEKITVKMVVNDPPTYIEPRPAETEEVPKFFIGENLGYHTLYVAYETDKGKREFYIPFTDDMVQQFDPYTLGEQTLVIGYKGKNWSHKIKIIEDERHIDSISINTPPNKTDYDIGEDFDVTGLAINAKFKDGTTSDNPIAVSSAWVSGFDSSTAGEKTLTVTYTDKYKDTATAEFSVIVGKGTVEKIEMESLPEKTTYAVGEALNLSGAQIKIIYAGGLEPQIKAVTSDMVSGYNSQSIGEQTITVTYTDDVGNDYTTEFNVTVTDEVKEITVNYMPKSTYELNDPIYLEGASLNVTFVNDSSLKVDITEDMISGFDSSSYGSHTATVSYVASNGTFTADFDYNVSKPCDLIVVAKPTNTYESKTPYIDLDIIYEDGTISSLCSLDLMSGNDDMIFELDNGAVKVTGFDKYQYDSLQAVTVEYKNLSSTAYLMMHTGPDPETTPIEGTVYGLGQKGLKTEFAAGERFSIPEGAAWSYIYWVKGEDGKLFPKRDGIPNSEMHEFPPSCVLNEIPLSPTIDGFSYTVWFMIEGHLCGINIKVNGTNSRSRSLFAQQAEFNSIFDTSEMLPIQNVQPDSTEILDNTYENTDGTDSTEPTETETEVTEPVDTEPTVTEPIVTETPATEPEVTETQVETSTVEEIPVLAIGDSGIFGFDRTAAKKSAQFANLHKNDIYNCYVVKSTSADILGKDNLLFVGQTSSDSMGSLSFEYETTTGEDGTVILRPMSDDPTTPDKPTTPDTPSDPTHPNNGGSSSNTAVIPVSATVTKTMTIKVENKITGETSKARGQKTGSSVTVKLGTENDGCYANVYTTDDEYICSAIIENGRAKFNVSNDVKLKIVIDSFAYGEDVSTAAGVFGDSAAENLPYAAVTAVIAIVGIYFKKRSEKKVK